jgi:hypothetical protein
VAVGTSVEDWPWDGAPGGFYAITVVSEGSDLSSVAIAGSNRNVGPPVVGKTGLGINMRLPRGLLPHGAYPIRALRGPVEKILSSGCGSRQSINREEVESRLVHHPGFNCEGVIEDESV